MSDHPINAGNSPVVLVAMPSTDLVHADFMMALVGMVMAPSRVRCLYFNSKSSLVTWGRNDCIAAAQTQGAEWVLFLDCDMVFPPDTLTRLLSHDKDIVGATYRKRVVPYDLLGIPLDPASQLTRGLVEMSHMPTGCLLIRTSVFEKLKRPYFRCRYAEDTGLIHGEDYVFSEMARALGYQLWCDADLSHQIGHLGQQVVRIK